MEEAVSERREVFAAAHRRDQDRKAYFSASGHASSVIAKTKAEAWQTTFSFLYLNLILNLCILSFILSLAVSSLSSFSANFSKCFSPRKSALVFIDYLRSQFSVSRPKALRSRAKDYISEPRTLKSLIRFFAPPFPSLSFLRLPQTFPHPLPLAQTKLPIPC